MHLVEFKGLKRTAFRAENLLLSLFIMAIFIEYQRQMWNTMTYFSLCRFHIDKEPSGKYKIKKAGPWRILFYYSLWVNSFIKLIYLILTYHGFTQEVHFLDQMSMWVWFLCFSQLVQEVNMWYRKYPLYEVLHANWTVQENIFKKLGSPKFLDEKIHLNDKILVYLHSTIVFVGCFALMIQFFEDPKYALFTYSVVPYDNIELQLLFAVHEYMYMFHIWVHQATSVVLSQTFAVSYTHIVIEMTQVLNKLIELAQLEEKGVIKPKESKRNKKEENVATTKEEIHKELEGNENKVAVEPKGGIKRSVNAKRIVPGTSYDIQTLLTDYKKIMIASNSFNKWVGKLMAGTNGSNYGTFISDVFMMIQLLKEPGVDLMGVFFFFEDAFVGVIVLFRMLILISRLYPASEGFLQAFKVYLKFNSPIKKYLLKYQSTLKIVAAQLAGYKTRPTTVPKGVNALMSYYIAAAMWERPKDRRT